MIDHETTKGATKETQTVVCIRTRNGDRQVTADHPEEVTWLYRDTQSLWMVASSKPFPTTTTPSRGICCVCSAVEPHPKGKRGKKWVFPAATTALGGEGGFV